MIVKLHGCNTFNYNLFGQKKKLNIVCKENTEFETLLKLNAQGLKGLISNLYQILLNQDIMAFDNKIRVWTKDCNYHFTREMWSKINRSYMVTTSLLTIKLQSIKLLNRWYLPPDHHFDKSLSPLCWKGCGHKASYIHCWWDCTTINKFWSKVVDQINLMLGLKIVLNVESILLNYWESNVVPNCNKDTVAILLAVAKLERAANWKSNMPPSMMQWCNRLWQTFVMYKITDTLLRTNNSNYESKLESTWFSVLSFLREKEIIAPRTLDKEFLYL